MASDSSLRTYPVGGQLAPAWLAPAIPWTHVRATATLSRPPDGAPVVDPTNNAHEHPLTVVEVLTAAQADGQWRTAPLKPTTSTGPDLALAPSGLVWGITLEIKRGATWHEVITYTVAPSGDRDYDGQGELVVIDGDDCIDVNALIPPPASVPASSIFEDAVLEVLDNNPDAIAADLAVSRTSTAVTVASSTGTDATLPAASTSLAGVLTGADKAKLDGIEAGATVGPTHRIEPDESDMIDRLNALFDLGIKDITLGAGDWVADIGQLSSTTANSLAPPAGTTIRGEAGTRVFWSQSGPYWPVFVLIETSDVTIRDIEFVHQGDYVTASSGTANLWGQSDFYDDRTQHYVVSATQSPRLSIINVRARGETRSNTFGGLLYAANCSDIRVRDVHVEDYSSAVLTGAGVTGLIDGFYADWGSTKCGAHYGPGHALYIFTDDLTVRNVHDEGNLSTYLSYGDGATIKWKTGGLTTRSNVRIENVFCKRAAGAIDIFGLRGAQVHGVRYEYLTTHPGFPDSDAAVALRSGSGEIAPAECQLSNINIRLADGDVTALRVSGDRNTLADIQVVRDIGADTYANPWIWMRGRNNRVEVDIHDRTGQSTSYRAPLLQLDGASIDNIVNLVQRSGFRTDPPKVILSDSATSGSIPTRNRVDLISHTFPVDGFDMSLFTLQDSITEDQAYGNNWLVNGQHTIIRRPATTATTISETFQTQMKAGSYLCQVMLASADANHAVIGTLIVTVDDRTNDFTSVQLVGSWAQKGTASNTPSAPTVTITAAGVITISGTRVGTVALNVRLAFQPLISMDRT